MGNRLSKIYTRTGDDGASALADGQRISKTAKVFDAMGDIDELNSHIGMALCLLKQLPPAQFNSQQTQHELTVIQHLLFNLGGELAMPEFTGIEPSHITWLEDRIDQMNGHLSPLKDFILPKGSLIVCQSHLARSVARRAERACVSLLDSPTPTKTTALQFINRLSDYLFVLGRYLTDDRHISETLWNINCLTTLNNTDK